MLNLQDRTPAPGKEGRVKITLDDGSTVEGVLEMADDAGGPGTPWNKQAGNLLQADRRWYTVAAGQSIEAGDVVDVVVERGDGTNIVKTLGEYAEGDIVRLNESGVPVDFYVAKHDYESGLNGAGRTLLVRKECYDTRIWRSPERNTCAASTINSWLSMTLLYTISNNRTINIVHER